MDADGKTNDQRFCSYDGEMDGAWSLPLRAKGPPLGTSKVHELQGAAYRSDGAKPSRTSLPFSVSHHEDLAVRCRRRSGDRLLPAARRGLSIRKGS
jgi:hypothetical protein